MRTAAQRIAKYNARMVSSLLDPVRTAVTAAAQANYASYTIEFVPKQQSLRAILDAAGLMPAQFAAYEACNGELYHAWKTTAGASLIKAFGVIIGRWAHASRLGVGAAALLKNIALVVYAVVVP